jgi:hypothetical protein
MLLGQGLCHTFAVLLQVRGRGRRAGRLQVVTRAEFGMGGDFPRFANPFEAGPNREASFL